MRFVRVNVRRYKINVIVRFAENLKYKLYVRFLSVL